MTISEIPARAGDPGCGGTAGTVTRATGLSSREASAANSPAVQPCAAGAFSGGLSARIRQDFALIENEIAANVPRALIAARYGVHASVFMASWSRIRRKAGGAKLKDSKGRKRLHDRNAVLDRWHAGAETQAELAVAFGTHTNVIGWIIRAAREEGDARAAYRRGPTVDLDAPSASNVDPAAPSCAYDAASPSSVESRVERARSMLRARKDAYAIAKACALPLWRVLAIVGELRRACAA